MTRRNLWGTPASSEAGKTPDPRSPAQRDGAADAGEARQPTLEELKAMANASVYADAPKPKKRGSNPSKERIDGGAERLPEAPGAVRPTQEMRSPAPRKKKRRHGSSELERVRRHGTGEHIRARRHGTGEHGRVRAVTTERLPAHGAGPLPTNDIAGRLGAITRAELTPNTAIVLSELRNQLAEQRDQAFNMAIERGDSSSADQYLQGRTQGLTEALSLLEKLIR